MSEAWHSQWQAADEVADFGRLFAVANARQHGDTDREQALSEFKPRQRFRCGHLDVVSNLFATVPLLLRDVTPRAAVREVCVHLLIDRRDDRVVEFLLVALQRQHVVGTGGDDLFRDGFLRPPRVDGDDRAAQVDQLQQLGNRRLSLYSEALRHSCWMPM